MNLIKLHRLQKNSPYLSIVSPVYQAEEILPELVRRIVDSLSQIDGNYEIILVDDRSPDKSWQVMKDLKNNYPELSIIRLSKNRGQHIAIHAGLEASSGRKVVVMDCDLQDLPEEIPNLLRKSEEGFEVVMAQRNQRSDNIVKRLSSKFFYWLFAWLTETPQDPEVANFGVYDRKVVDAVLKMNDERKFFPAQVKWVGFNKAKLSVKHAERYKGKSTYNFRNLLTLALDTILSFSDKPLRLTVKFGFILAITSGIFGIVTLYRYLTGQILVLGFTSLILSIWFLSGVIISIMGIIGLYVGRTYEQSKDRPNYIIDEFL